MNFSKYSGTDGVTIGSFTSISSSSSSSSSSSESRTETTASLDRTLWGNQDDGGDISETMYVDGSIYIGQADFSDEDGDSGKSSSDTGYSTRDDDSGGNLYVEKAVYADTTEANETYGKKLYLNYPTVDDSKSNLASLLRSHDDDLVNLDNRLRVLESKPDGVQVTDFENLSNIINYGDWTHPIILFAGRVYRSTVLTGHYDVSGVTNPNITVTADAPSGGLLTLTLSGSVGKTVNVRSVVANQENSGSIPNDITNTSPSGRSKGASWLICQVDTNTGTSKVYLREVGLRDSNNDSWGSSDWTSTDAIKSAYVTIFGYITKS